MISNKIKRVIFKHNFLMSKTEIKTSERLCNYLINQINNPEDTQHFIRKLQLQSIKNKASGINPTNVKKEISMPTKKENISLYQYLHLQKQIKQINDLQNKKQEEMTYVIHDNFDKDYFLNLVKSEIEQKIEIEL